MVDKRQGAFARGTEMAAMVSLAYVVPVLAKAPLKCWEFAQII
jgi:hypothetical protein